MGVSGSGKSSVARALVARTGWAFVEGDDLHPPDNIAKMRAGRPLTDADRWPWLDRVAQVLRDTTSDTVLTCSALKRAYRDRLRQACPDLVFALLAVDEETLRARLEQRQGHFLPPSLLTSQLATLEALERDEAGLTVTGAAGPDDAAEQILRALA